MTISDFSVHNVLRTYNKQFKIGKLVKNRKSAESSSKSDAVEISTESKKLLFIKSISAQVAEEIDSNVPTEEVEKKISDNLDNLIKELAAEISPDSEEFIDVLVTKLIELF